MKRSFGSIVSLGTSDVGCGLPAGCLQVAFVASWVELRLGRGIKVHTIKLRPAPHAFTGFLHPNPKTKITNHET